MRTKWALTKVSRAFRRGEEGQGLAEYALILGFVAVACVAALTAFGTSVSGHLNSVAGLF
jgi:Flp pilus assembly pilin Flp